MSYKTKVLVAPVAEPVTLSEAKSQLRIEDSFTIDDDYINSLISVARDRAEQFCNRFFTEQTIAILYSESLPASVIDLPYPDLASISSLSYIDSDGATTAVSSGDYTFNSEYQTIRANDSFPLDSISYRVEAVTAAPVVADAVKQAILMMITDMYELRTESVVGKSLAVNHAVKAALYPYRVELGV